MIERERESNDASGGMRKNQESRIETKFFLNSLAHQLEIQSTPRRFPAF